jgi:hypothetical protein
MYACMGAPHADHQAHYDFKCDPSLVRLLPIRQPSPSHGCAFDIVYYTERILYSQCS